jgi:hypothetical protein
MSTANPPFTSRVQTRPSALRDEWQCASLYEQFNYILGFEGNYVRTCRIHHFTGEERISPNSGQRVPQSVRFLTDTFMCLFHGARNVFMKRSLESGTSRTYVTSVFNIIACSHACRAVHRQCVPKYTNWVEAIFQSFKSTQITDFQDTPSSADSW